MVSSPAIGKNGTVYVGSHDSKLYALDCGTGAKKWEVDTGGSVTISPAIGPNGAIYFGSWDKIFYALKSDCGGLIASPWSMRGQNAQHTGRALNK